MKKLKHQFWAKFLACVLFTAAVGTVVLGLCDIAYVSGTGGYGTWGSTMEDIYDEAARMYGTAVFYRFIYNYAWEDWPAYYPSDLPEFLDTENVSYSVTDENGTVVCSGGSDAVPYYSVTREVRGRKWEQSSYGEIHIPAESELTHYTLSVGLCSDARMNDPAQWMIGAVRLGYNLRWAMFGIVLAALALAVLCAVFICASAGHRKAADGTDELRLTLRHRLPLGIWLGLHAAAALGAIALLVWLTETSYTDVLVFFLFMASLLVLFLLCQFFVIWFNLAARLKDRQWYRHTLTYFFGRIIFRGARFLWRTFVIFCKSIPLIWRVLVILAVCFLWSLSDMVTHSAFLWLLGWFIQGVGVIWCTLCFVRLRQAASRLNEGELSFKVDTKYMPWGLKRMGEDLNGMGEGLSRAVEARTRSDRMKTELITNVTHDIKTPLTSIINYSDLLQNEPLEGAGNAAEYAEVIHRQSERMKKLISDLIDLSKATTGNMKFIPEDVDLSVMTAQAVGEYEERFAARQLTPLVSGTDVPAVVTADGGLCWRIWDNLLSNILKYSMPGTRVYIDLQRTDDGNKVSVTFRNISEQPITVSAAELTERFVRGDEARSSEGSGLGLSIAQSLAALQGGSLTLATEGDLFRACVTFPLKPEAGIEAKN